MITKLPMKWGCMMNKLSFLSILFIYVYAESSCFSEIPPILLKDTIIDCNHITFLYRAEECSGFSLQLHGWVEAKQMNCYDRISCRNLHKLDSTVSIEPDSVKVNSRKKKFLYKNGIVYETNEMIKGRRYNEKFIYDTTIRDTTYQLKMKSFFINDSLIKRNIEIDTLIPSKKHRRK